jgi:tetratricopeptide (TPR) repeat protein
MPLTPDDRKHLESAFGYVELGMLEQADAELEELNAIWRARPELLGIRLAVYLGLQKWKQMESVAQSLVEADPQEPAHFGYLAFATRYARSIAAARAILFQAAKLHPRNAMIQFNLACYEAQLGNLPAAKAYLNRATELDSKLSVEAIDDPDLKPLWESLSEPTGEDSSLEQAR